MELKFYRGKTVLVTGDTGFKGSWLSLWLLSLGARVIGYALPPKKANILKHAAWPGKWNISMATYGTRAAR